MIPDACPTRVPTRPELRLAGALLLRGRGRRRAPPHPALSPTWGEGGERLGLGCYDFDGHRFRVAEDDVVTDLDLVEPLHPGIDLDGLRVALGSLEGDQPLLVVDLLHFGTDLHGVHRHGLGL